MEEKLLATVDLVKNKPVSFYSTYLLYKGNKIYYKDIDGVSYLRTDIVHSVYFVPVSKTSRYSAAIRSNGKNYDLKFSPIALLKHHRDKSENNYNTIVQLFEKNIEPFVINRLLLEYGENFKLEMKGFMTITPEGLYRNGLFWSKPEFLPWDEYHSSHLVRGQLLVYKKFNNNAGCKLFFNCPTTVFNAVIMPTLLKFLFENGGSISTSKRNELLKNKKEQESLVSASLKTSETEAFCPKCGQKVLNSRQNFCNKCGKKLT